jgi:hypothetical protein
LRAALLALVLLVAAGSSATASRGRASATVSAEQLLAADVPWSTVQQLAGKSFWPQPPGFDTTVFQNAPQPRAAASQVFEQIGGKGLILTRVLAFASAADSLDYLQGVQVVGERVDQDSPDVGDGHAYYQMQLGDGTPATRFYFTRGPLAAYVQIDHGAWSQARIGQLAAPIDEKLQQLLAGRLRAPSLPAVSERLLPSAAAAPGRVLGTTAIPAEAWATIVLRSSPQSVRARLVAAGNRMLPFRRYLRRNSNSDAIETTVFTFPSADAARAWFAPFGAAVRRKTEASLPTGKTGSASAFRYLFGSYELQFVAGRYVGDVFCWAPFTTGASSGCEEATRTLAENWYAQLSKR